MTNKTKMCRETHYLKEVRDAWTGELIGWVPTHTRAEAYNVGELL